jgi:hypothetical protein
MSNFDRLYEKVMRHGQTLDMSFQLDKKPLTMIDKGDKIKVFGYLLDGTFKELLSVKRDVTGNVIARNFVYKNSPLNYYYMGNKKVQLPHYNER